MVSIIRSHAASENIDFEKQIEKSPLDKIGPSLQSNFDIDRIHVTKNSSLIKFALFYRYLRKQCEAICVTRRKHEAQGAKTALEVFHLPKYTTLTFKTG